MCMQEITAAIGDTTSVRSHDEVHWSWNGNKDNWAEFPDGNTEYEKILMYYTLGCPSTGCSEWDYTTKIEALVYFGNDTLPTPVELARVITPYAGNYPVNWSNTWIFDVTDYAPILKDSLQIRGHYSGYQDGFTITLDFHFIEGTPPREVIALQNIYHGNYKYGFANNPINTQLAPQTLDVDALAKGAMVRVIPTGHSFGGNENCAEFCPKNYQIHINGNQRFEQLAWRDDCGMNPLYPQGGTWIYDRSNWCPGEKAIARDHEITPYVTPGSSFDLDMTWDAYSYNGGAGFDPSYILSVQLFQYGDYNFDYDLEVLEVIAPSDKFKNNRFNPICDDPKIILKNRGANAVFSADIVYGIKGQSTRYAQKWVGSLDPGQATEVLLSNNGFIFTGLTGTEEFEVEVIEPNGQEDEYTRNNYMVSSFELVPEYDSLVLVFLRTNNAPSETSWEIKNDRDSVVFKSASNLSAGSTYRDTLLFSEGCYTFTLYDSDCDGLSFFANNDGAGTARLFRVGGGGAYVTFNPDFGCQVSQSFVVGKGYTGPIDTLVPPPPDTTTSITDLDELDGLMIFPNPAEDLLHVRLNSAYKGSYQINVFTIQGTLVIDKQGTSMTRNTASIDVGGLPAGVYFVQVSTSNGRSVRKLVIQ